MDSDLKQLIDNARAHGACKDGLTGLNKLTTMDEALAHPNAPYWAYLYALHVIEGRWELAEPVIATDPRYAYLYTLHLIKGRWELAEPVIATNPYCAYWYSRNIIKGRWELAEPVIATNPFCAYWYNSRFGTNL